MSAAGSLAQMKCSEGDVSQLEVKDIQIMVSPGSSDETGDG